MAGTEREDASIPELDTERPTAEVASEGGSPGDVEINRGRDVAGGSEATETLRPADEQVGVIRRDETGEGRRSPSGAE